MREELRRWVEEAAGGRVVASERGFGGGSRELWLLGVRRPGGDVAHLVLRAETGTGTYAGTPFSLGREAVVYRALQGTGVPVPELVGVAPGGSALLLERAPGSPDLGNLDGAGCEAVRDGFLRALATLHGLDPGAIPLEGFAVPATPEDHARDDLAVWARLATDRVEDLDPLLAFALAWLDARPPTAVARTALVQGDAGPGNFLVHEGRVSALVDWELAHLGDPVDDLAWLDVRVAGAPGAEEVFGGTAARCGAYERLTGHRVEPASLRYYRVFVLLRCAVTTSMTIGRGGGALGLFGYLAAHHGFLRRLGWALADACGVAVVPAPHPGPEPAADPGAGGLAPATTREILLERAEADLAGVTASLAGDREARLRLNGVLALLHHLRAFDRLGPALDEADRADRTELLGAGPAVTGEADGIPGRLAAEAGRAGDPRVLAYLVRRADRAAMLWAGTRGSGSDPLPPVPDRWTGDEDAGSEAP